MNYECFHFSKLAEEELKMNIAETEKFVLPSGQEVEKEGKIVSIVGSLITLWTIFWNVYMLLCIEVLFKYGATFQIVWFLILIFSSSPFAKTACYRCFCHFWIICFR